MELILKIQKKLRNYLKINSKTNSSFFDVIIDDGSHYLSDILYSLKTLFKYIEKGGLYIIEDYKHPNYYTITEMLNIFLLIKC